MKHRLELRYLSRMKIAALALGCCYVTSCELITTIDRSSIGYTTSISGNSSTTGAGSASGPSSGGTINAGSGGQAATSTNNTGSGGGTSSTGGTSSLAGGCNGTWQGHVCGMNTIQVDGGIDTDATNTGSRCDLSLNSTPSISPDRLLVLIDCVPQPVVPAGTLDASAVNGFSMDYTQDPAHLLLHGTCCEAVEAPGTHVVDVIAGCGCCD